MKMVQISGWLVDQVIRQFESLSVTFELRCPEEISDSSCPTNDSESKPSSEESQDSYSPTVAEEEKAPSVLWVHLLL